jgi:hypothetical protein
MVIGTSIYIALVSLGLLTTAPHAHSVVVETFDTLTAVFLIPLPLALHRLYRASAPRLSLLALIVGLAAAIFVAILHALFVREVVWFSDAVLLFLAGVAAAGVWLLLTGYLAQATGRLPGGLLMSLVAMTGAGYPVWAVWLGHRLRTAPAAVLASSAS